MKKLICAITAIMLLIISSLPVNALTAKTYLFVLKEEDMVGENYELFLLNCHGQYSKESDSVTVYITNYSDREGKFEVLVGYSGSKVKTDISVGSVGIKNGVTAKFVIENISSVPEKANDDLGYVPNSFLDGDSVIRIKVSGLTKGDSFTVSGMSVGRMMSTSFKPLSEGGHYESVFNEEDINEAKSVIPDDGENTVESEKTDKYTNTLEQPTQKEVTFFITLVAIAVAMFAGGAIIYICALILKRRREDA